ncbi:MAG: hypothetical protein GEU98_08080 [Pseudonocardiaceae bacterium]|nr:hypothetical protein [Pseudonocardiaceae bacterium]
MSEPIDPDAWQRGYETKLAGIEQRNERMTEELQQVRVTERSTDGQVSVTVNNHGALVDLQLGEALRQRDGSAVAGEVVRLASVAQGKVADAVRRAMQPYIGGTEAMNYLVDRMRAAQPPEEPQGYTPGGGGYSDADSFLRSNNADGDPESPQPPPRPPRPSHDDDDFGGGSILR